MKSYARFAGALLLAVACVPGVSFAQSENVADLQAEIASLTAQLQQLEAQLASQVGGGARWCHTFSTNLSIGMSGADINALQNALGMAGETIRVTGTFDDQTAAAVTAFQEKYANDILLPYGLNNGTGYAGKATRSKLNSLLGCSGVSSTVPLGSISALPSVAATSSSSVHAFTIQNDPSYSPLNGVSVSTGVTLMMLDITNSSNDPITLSSIGATQSVLSPSGSQISVSSPDFANVSLREVAGTQATNVGTFATFTGSGSSWSSVLYPSALTIPANATEKFLVVADVVPPSINPSIVEAQGQITISAQNATAVDTTNNAVVSGTDTASASISIMGSSSNPTSTIPTTSTVSQVQGLTATANGNAVMLNWQPATTSDNDSVIYNIYRSFTTISCTTNSGYVGQVHGTSYTDSQLSTGVYYYCVQAQDTNGNYLGPLSAQASAVVSSAAAIAPPSLVFSLNSAIAVPSRVQMGATGVRLLNFDVANPSGNPIKITLLPVYEAVSSSASISIPEFNNLAIYSITGGQPVLIAQMTNLTQIQGGGTPPWYGAAYPSNMTIPANSTTTFSIIGDALSASANPSVVGTQWGAAVSGAADVIAVDTLTNATAETSGTVTGSLITVVQGQ